MSSAALYRQHRQWLGQAMPALGTRDARYAILDWLTRRADYVEGGQHTKVAPLRRIADDVGISRRHARRLVSRLAGGVMVGEERVLVLARHLRPDEDHPHEPSCYEILSAGLQRLAELGPEVTAARRRARKLGAGEERAAAAGRAVVQTGAEVPTTKEDRVESDAPAPSARAQVEGTWDPAACALDLLGPLALDTGASRRHLERLWRQVPLVGDAEARAQGWREGWTVLAAALQAGAELGPEWAAMRSGYQIPGERGRVPTLCSVQHWGRRVAEARAYVASTEEEGADDEDLAAGTVWIPPGQVERPPPTPRPGWDQVFASLRERLGHDDAEIWYADVDLVDGPAGPCLVVPNGAYARWQAEHHLELLGELVGAPVAFTVGT